MRGFVFVSICIALAHGEVLDLTGAATSQKDTYDGNVAGRAIDGAMTSCSSTHTNPWSWWAVALPDATTVTSVTIAKGETNFEEFVDVSEAVLNNVRVGVTDEDPALTVSGYVGWQKGKIDFVQECGFFEGLVTTDEITIHCTSGCVTGKYLVIQIGETSRPDDKDDAGHILAMCKVEVEVGTAAQCALEAQVPWGVLEGGDEGHQYAFIAPATSWFDSADSCDMMGGYLVEVNSAEEDAAIAKYVRANYDVLGLTGSTGRVWIGGSDDAVEGKWVWDASQRTFDGGYTNWDTSRHQPNDNLGNQNCASYFFKKSDMWDDDTCTSNHKAYICERTAPDAFTSTDFGTADNSRGNDRHEDETEPMVETIVAPIPIINPVIQPVDENLETSDFNFDVTPGMSAAGAECHRFDDLHECMEFCWVMEDCFGIDWNHAANPWCHCWIHTSDPGPMSPNADVDHYKKAYIAPMDK